MKNYRVLTLFVAFWAITFSTFAQEEEEPEMVVASSLKVNTTGIDPTAQKEYNNAISATEVRDYNKAYRLFSEAIKIAPDFTKAYINRGHVLVNLERFEEAKADYLKAVTLDPSLDAVYVELGSLAATQDSLTEALNYLQKAHTIDPSNQKYSYQLGVYYFLIEDYETAVNYFTNIIDVIAKSPNIDLSTAQVYNDRGAAFKELDKVDEAIADFLMAFKLDPQLVVAQTNLGAIYREQKNYSEAIRFYSQALFIDQHNTWIRNNRALSYFEQGDYEAAKRDLKAILEFQADDVFAYNNLAGIALKEKDYQAAIDYANQAIAVDANAGQAYCNRGIANEMLRNEAAACADWSTAAGLGIDIADRFFQRNNCSSLISE